MGAAKVGGNRDRIQSDPMYCNVMSWQPTSQSHNILHEEVGQADRCHSDRMDVSNRGRPSDGNPSKVETLTAPARVQAQTSHCSESSCRAGPSDLPGEFLSKPTTTPILQVDTSTHLEMRLPRENRMLL